MYQDNIIKKITPKERLLILLILIFCVMISKSIFLILFLTTLILILMIKTEKSVRYYVKALKKVSPLLLIYLVLYIIMLRRYSFLPNLILLYKLLLITILIEIYVLNIDFKEFNCGIYGILKPLERFLNVEKLSHSLSLSIYYVKCLLDSFDNIKYSQIKNGKRVFNIKNYLLPIFMNSIEKLTSKDETLKMTFFRVDNKSNIISKIFMVLFIIIFVVCIFKEVVW